MARHIWLDSTLTLREDRRRRVGRAHVRPEHRYRPPGGPGLRRRNLRRVRKALTGHYYQLLSGHAATSSFLHDGMSGT